MFYFSAERLNVGESPYQDAKRLSHNADNLAAVLATLQGSKGSTFDRLKQHLKGIFPTFGNLSVRPKPGSNLAEIVIWPTEAMDEPELGFPLSESGTGVGQVLAILSVVMTTTESVIIIDEINSFLHPGAVKTLLRLLQTEYSHQIWLGESAHLG
jgi:predicted ATPase